jgi:hypothetical protein
MCTSQFDCSICDFGFAFKDGICDGYDPDLIGGLCFFNFIAIFCPPGCLSCSFSGNTITCNQVINGFFFFGSGSNRRIKRCSKVC